MQGSQVILPSTSSYSPCKLHLTVIGPVPVLTGWEAKQVWRPVTCAVRKFPGSVTPLRLKPAKKLGVPEQVICSQPSNEKVPPFDVHLIIGGGDDSGFQPTAQETGPSPAFVVALALVAT